MLNLSAGIPADLSGAPASYGTAGWTGIVQPAAAVAVGANGAWASVVSKTFSPGKYMLAGAAKLAASVATTSGINVALSLNATSLDVGHFQVAVPLNVSTASQLISPIRFLYVPAGSTTTVYLLAQLTWTVLTGATWTTDSGIQWMEF